VHTRKPGRSGNPQGTKGLNRDVLELAVTLRMQRVPWRVIARQVKVNLSTLIRWKDRAEWQEARTRHADHGMISPVGAQSAKAFRWAQDRDDGRAALGRLCSVTEAFAFGAECERASLAGPLSRKKPRLDCGRTVGRLP